MQSLDKRRLSKIPRESATSDMMQTAERLGGVTHIATARSLEDEKILQLTFYETSKLKQRKPGAAFRTFLSGSDYITQDLKVSNVRWLTAAFDSMQDFSLLSHRWDPEKKKSSWIENVFIWSGEEKKLMEDFFSQYSDPKDEHDPWDAIRRFQDEVRKRRLIARHKKETDRIDAVMEPVKDAPAGFFDWIWESGMSFSRYLIYKAEKKGSAVCECTHCKKIGVVNRKEIRLRNNEKGTCPFCGSRVTIKARGRMPAQISDERWSLYVDPTQDGFILRYFKANRNILSDRKVDKLIDKSIVTQGVHEYSRVFCTFPNGKPESVSYEWGSYKQWGMPRWCPDKGRIACAECILYPGNLPQAWAHTPMRYSALEVLAANIPTVSMHYGAAMKAYLDFPRLEWLCKMGLNNLARNIIEDQSYFHRMVSKVDYKGKTIYEILGLTKINTRVLQAVDGDDHVLRLLQVSQQIGFQFEPEQLQAYYGTFECNTELLMQAGRKVSLHKLVRYIERESERYPLGDGGGCGRYAYMMYREREDPRIERKRNMAKDWLEYLGWCRELGYDLDDMFIYMPTNFKKVHDRTAKEYQGLKDRQAAAERERREREVKRQMEQTRRALEEILKTNDGMDAFSIKGKGLVLVVPETADDIKAEGEALHHCVGSYVDRVARGETSIFFVRRADSPDRPYFTLEWKNNDVSQCRGFHNCDMTPDVKAFTQAFKKKMLDSSKKDKKEMGRCD